MAAAAEASRYLVAIPAQLQQHSASVHEERARRDAMAAEALAAAVQHGCRDLPQAAVLREALELCEVEGHRFYSDGNHLSVEGIEHIASAVEELATSVAADVVVSDSCLCAVTSDGEDRTGSILDSLLSVPVRPRWGASFARGSFKQAVYQAWREFRDVRVVMVLIAGNDLWDDQEPEELTTHMETLQNYWLTGDVELVYVDVIPRTWLQA